MCSSELKLSKYDTVGRKVFRPGDANMQALNLANALRRDNKMKALVLLDPFGMQINWEVIESLSGSNIDLWILIPSGVIVNRLLKTNGELMYPDRLVQFFGLPEQELMDRFYVRKKTTYIVWRRRNHRKEESLHRAYCRTLLRATW